MKKLLAIFSLGLGVLTAVLFIRAGLVTATPVEVLDLPTPKLDAGRLAARLAQALRYRTISTDDPADRDPAPFAELRDFIAATFPLVHERLERTHDVAEEAATVLVWRGTDTTAAPILFLAHADVVPVSATTLTKWSHPPFAGTIADGYIWGRGAMDFKLGMMGILEAVEQLLKEGFTPTRSVYFVFGNDEEVGGENGAALVAKSFARRGLRFEFVLDEGLAIIDGLLPGIDVPVAMIGIAEKGYVSFELTANGEGGHSSMPPPHTTVGLLSSAVHRLEETPFPAGLTEPTRKLFTTLAPHMGFGRRVLFANLWLTEGLLVATMEKKPSSNALVRTTTAATMFTGSPKENVLPTTAKAVVNFRIRPGETRASVRERVIATIDDPRVAVEMTTGMASDPSPISSDQSPAFDLLRRAIKTTYPEVIVAPSLVVGGTDSRHFQSVADDVYRFIPETIRPGDPARIHGINERLGVEDYANAVRFYHTFLRASSGGTLP